MTLREPLDPSTLEVKIAELLVATADGADLAIDEAVPGVLRLLRDRMNMDVVFVSEFTGGQRVFRYADQTPGREVVTAGESDPLETSWCQRVVDGRLPGLIADAAPLQRQDPSLRTPFPIGTHLSTPIVLDDGEVYGTLCCFSFSVNPQITEQDLRRLRYTADLTASKINRSRGEDS